MAQAKDNKTKDEIKPEGFTEFEVDPNVIELARSISKDRSEKDLLAIRAKIEVLEEFRDKIFLDHKGKTIPTKTLLLKLQATIEVFKEFLSYRREVNKHVK